MNGVTLDSGAGLSHARTTKSSYSDNSGKMATAEKVYGLRLNHSCCDEFGLENLRQRVTSNY